jgi:hypothetical protein
MLKQRFRLAVVVAVVAVAAMAPARVTAAPLTADLTIGPTTIETSLVGPVTVSGTATATITQFRVNENGQLVAIATVSGTATATVPGGMVTVDVTRARVILRASVQANCSGQLAVTFNGVAQLNATVTVTKGGKTATFQITETFPLHGSLSFTAQTAEQQALICEISQLLQTRASTKALVDKLNTLLATL